MHNDNFGDRMKSYENVFRYYLPARLPLIVRLDMRAGHTYTRNFVRPYDSIFHYVMVETAIALCHDISGAKLAYTQSDEISILITNDDSIATQPWFDNNLQKIVSLTAAQASITFQNTMRELVEKYNYYNKEEYDFFKQTYLSGLNKVMFDSRAFILPPHEINNYFYWRQTDWRRNSINMLARTYFSQKQLQNKSCDEMMEMLREKNADWYSQSNWKKYGACIVKQEVEMSIHYNDEMKIVKRRIWKEDMTTPCFLDDDYITSFLPGE